MGYQESVPDVPQIIPATEFGLTEPLKNRSMREPFFVGTPELLIDDPNFRVILVGHAGSGKIALIEKDGDWMAYFVEYELIDTFLGRSVTQVTIWRDKSSAYVAGITRRMFFDVLLPRFHSIISDGQQTKDGRDFWTTRMAEAAARGFKVGLADVEQHQVKWLQPGTNFRSWIGSNDGWGTSEEHRQLRYVIAST